jgi:hypothetical protein
LAEALAEGLSVGHPDMPELVFEPDQIVAILAYLKSIQEHRLDIAGLRITVGNYHCELFATAFAFFVIAKVGDRFPAHCHETTTGGGAVS